MEVVEAEVVAVEAVEAVEAVVQMWKLKQVQVILGVVVEGVVVEGVAVGVAVGEV